MTLPTAQRASIAYNGQSILAFVFLIGGIIVLTGLALAFLATSFLNSAYGFRAAQRAQAVASAGVYDALMRLDRNSGFSSVGYDVTLGNDTAHVVVTQNLPSTGKATIVSTATVTLRQRTINVVVANASSTGQIVVVSWAQS
jgi:hypothetical protein